MWGACRTSSAFSDGVFSLADSGSCKSSQCTQSVLAELLSLLKPRAERTQSHALPSYSAKSEPAKQIQPMPCKQLKLRPFHVMFC